MKRQYWLFVVLVALLMCVAVLLLLVTRINDARSNLSQASPGAFNYLFQGSRNIDAFVDSLRDIGDIEGEPDKLAEVQRLYRQRFDVLWGGFSVFEINFRAQPEQQQTVSDLIDFSRNYLTSNEHLMASGYTLSKAEIATLIAGAREISEKLVNVSHRYFIYASHRSDVWDQKLHTLYQLFWVCVAFLVLTATLLVNMLMRSRRRSAELMESSHRTQAEMKRLIDELRSGKLENKAKDSFIAAASHDLRQPLHALGLFLGATEKHIDNEAGRKSLAEAKTCAAELNKLFNSLLDLSRLDAGVVEVNENEFKVQRLLRLMEQEFLALANEAGIELEVECSQCYVRTDALLLNRVLRNLIENAIMHSGASKIRIECENLNEKIRLSVIDNGVGIPVEDQSDIFSEYYQLENPERDRSKGLGLGLSIVKRLCEILHVRVSVESEPGAGTSFHLDVPAGTAKANKISKLATLTDEPEAANTGALVAVIDDDASIRRGMISILESLDFNAIAAESANEMIDELKTSHLMPDVLVADYRLRENQTGDVAIRHVRSAFNQEFPAMIITGDTSPGRVNEAAGSGFELLHKPVEPVELMRRINRLLQE